MTKKFFTLLLAVTAGIGTTFAERVQIGDLYYYIDNINYTAEVTSQRGAYPYWSTSITTANIPASVTYNFETYSVTSIGSSAFGGCSGLTSVTIPNSVTSIGDWAFRECSGLTSIEIPNSVTSIDRYAFYECSSLTSIEIPNSVTSIGEEAFCDCSGLTSVTIGNSVTSIGYHAFYGCSSLTSVTIPNSVTSIGGSVFAECTGLTSVVVEKGNSVYDSRNNCNAIIETATNTLIAGCQNTIIPNSVTSIGAFAFYTCSGLTSVTIPNSVTNIGIGAFRSCTNLTSVTIPNSVKYIRSYAFYNCKGLTSVYNYATSPQDIDSNVFGGEEGEEDGIQYGPVDKTTCKLYVPAQSINLYKAAIGWRDFKNILPVESSDQAIDNTPFPSGEGRGEASKILHNSQILILRGDKTYTLTGAAVK